MNKSSSTRVLVIDGDAHGSDQLATFLGDHGYEVMTCPATEHASMVLSQWRPHVMVLHPGALTCREALTELRRLSPRVPIVLVTADAGQELLLEIEAFAPALPATRASLDGLEDAVAAAALAA